MSREKESQCLEEFIDIYQSESCLWKMKSKEYHDTWKRDAAYKLLTEKLKEIDSSATKSTTVKKINNLRNSYRKELKKVKESTRTGSEADEIYEPKLWYYKMLYSLGDQDIPRNSSSNLESDDESSINEDETQSINIDMSDCSASENTDESLLSPSIPNPILRQTSDICRRPHGNTKQSNQFALTNESLLTGKDHFKQPRIREDRFDIFGKNVAMKLRDLSTPQRVMAEKLINDVLFEGEMENLSTSHKLSYGSNSQLFRMNPLLYPQTTGYGSVSSSTSSSSAQSPLHQYYLLTPQFQE